MFNAVFWPLSFVSAASYCVWNFPSYLLLFNLAGLGLGNTYQAAGWFDVSVLILACLGFVLGVLFVTPIEGELPVQTWFDRIGLFAGRISMVLIMTLAVVMAYEVVVRYIFAAPTLWANELSLWIAGLVFLLVGFYAQQQRIHIRIDILHSALRPSLRRCCDIVSSLCLGLFASAFVWGCFNDVQRKLSNWERFGTSFNPPIPATLLPLLALIIVLIAVQSFINLVVDWNAPGPGRAVDSNQSLER
ncbi:TRAP transporter small permease subunit [Pseudomonas sp. M30-35]|uniref:TRAP transporter small permease subunit n=1 Tax=Pseudomonas sp. M30-35 TaxID=1981174 RepID=UPI0012FD2733|nr:TRAP transporter small permease subunit [Pseudomonas sp. M30-35]